MARIGRIAGHLDALLSDALVEQPARPPDLLCGRPLDRLPRDWNRVYGRRGFTQLQCVLPDQDADASARRVFETLRELRAAPLLTVIKDCGAEGRGLISFPRPGIAIAPDFAMPGLEATDPAERRRQAEAWCDKFEERNAKWLKSTVATLDEDGEPQLAYEEVDTSLVPPRPRLYGLVGAEAIEEVWKERVAAN